MTEDDPASEMSSTQRLCPVCGMPLAPTTVKGITVDACEDHGIWLDNGELSSILARQRRSMSNSKRSAVSRARKDGKVSGALFGWMSLLFD